MTLSALIACPHLQRNLAAFLPRFAELGIEVEAPQGRPAAQRGVPATANIHRFDGVVAGDVGTPAAAVPAHAEQRPRGVASGVGYRHRWH